MVKTLFYLFIKQKTLYGKNIYSPPYFLSLCATHSTFVKYARVQFCDYAMFSLFTRKSIFLLQLLLLLPMPASSSSSSYCYYSISYSIYVYVYSNCTLFNQRSFSFARPFTYVCFSFAM